MADELTFVIKPETRSASIGLFLKALQDISRLIRDVDYAIYGGGAERRWVINGLEASSPAVTVQPLLGNRQTIDAIGEGLRAVTGGTDQPPQYFTEQALQDLKKMRRLFRGKDRAKSIVVSVNHEETATIEHDISEKDGRILTAGYKNLGSLEGPLEAINALIRRSVGKSRSSCRQWQQLRSLTVRVSTTRIPKRGYWNSSAGTT